MTLILILVLYTIAHISVSCVQISFLKKMSKEKAVILDEKAYLDAANISIENQKFDIFSHFYNFIIKILWLSFGFLWLKELLIKENTLFENTLYLLAFLLIGALLNLPLSLYESFVKDKKHGFSNMSMKLFIVDTLKSLVLMLVFGFLILYALLFCYEFLGSLWWFAAFLLSFVVILIINLIYPTIIAPMFNKMSKLEDEHLLAKITALMQKCGFSANGVFVMDASKRDKRLNAYFGGLFKSKRVVLFDTLLKALNERELLAVLGHELGHFVHKDLIKGLFLSAFMVFVLFFVFAHLPEFFYTQSHLDGVLGGVFALLLIFGDVFTFIFSPLLNFLSRKNEFSADLHGAKMSSKEDMKSALLALARENKAFIESSRLYEFFHLSHPSILKRIKALS
ncbi:peptidase M48 [Campylobacter sp. MIT 99-7217]|uniref:M48 family metallopeptidase n=1 Tax=Campylobacter sp. MIT 99-7217 TaxID=535091 RepID=UPI001158BB73|nr:M48 family metallopeptidase [Campylobacter sp. MIT 99-7217]TQR34726.1 peptidase M48 [Campylobacter sp. MIT 99-7217]